MRLVVMACSGQENSVPPRAPIRKPFVQHDNRATGFAGWREESPRDTVAVHVQMTTFFVVAHFRSLSWFALILFLVSAQTVPEVLNEPFFRHGNFDLHPLVQME